MRRWMVALLLSGILAGCGGSGNAATSDPQAVLDTWAKHVMQGDMATAKTLMDNPTFDWENRTLNAQENGAFTSYYLVGGWNATERGQEARLVWERDGLEEFVRYICTTVLVTPKGKIQITDDTALCTKEGSFDVIN